MFILKYNILFAICNILTQGCYIYTNNILLTYAMYIELVLLQHDVESGLPLKIFLSVLSQAINVCLIAYFDDQLKQEYVFHLVELSKFLIGRQQSRLFVRFLSFFQLPVEVQIKKRTTFESIEQMELKSLPNKERIDIIILDI